jgi:hypothetical protein
MHVNAQGIGAVFTAQASQVNSEGDTMTGGKHNRQRHDRRDPKNKIRVHKFISSQQSVDKE